jgi:hypothetical protein
VKARNHSRVAEALPHSEGIRYKPTVKSGCAREWGAWGRLSDDGPGHYNPDRSEDPWGKGNIASLERWCATGSLAPTLEGDVQFGCGAHAGSRPTVKSEGYAGSRLNRITLRAGPI